MIRRGWTALIVTALGLGLFAAYSGVHKVGGAVVATAGEVIVGEGGTHLRGTRVRTLDDDRA